MIVAGVAGGVRLAVAFLFSLLVLLPVHAVAQETMPLDAAERERLGGSFLELPDGWVHYQVSGEENPDTVVLVHGFSVPSFVWRGVLPYLLNAGLRVVVYDNYGRGFSDRPGPPYDLGLFDRQLDGVINGLTAEGARVGLVGYSMGGAIVTEYAARRPERVAAVALIAPAGYPVGLPLAARLTRLPLVGEWLFAVLAPRVLSSRVEQMAALPGAPRDFVERYNGQLRYPGYVEALGSTLVEYPLSDMRERYRLLGASALPVMAVWGDSDKVVPYSSSKFLAEDVPGLELNTIEGGAHAITFTRPQVVGPQLAAFFGRVRAGFSGLQTRSQTPKR